MKFSVFSALFQTVIDIGLSAHQNARKMHSEKKAAIEKQRKTVQSSAKALKSAQQKTKQTLETVRFPNLLSNSNHNFCFTDFWFVATWRLKIKKKILGPSKSRCGEVTSGDVV